eukprot:4701075-Amphidinium_carterae.1
MEKGIVVVGIPFTERPIAHFSPLFSISHSLSLFQLICVGCVYAKGASLDGTALSCKGGCPHESLNGTCLYNQPHKVIELHVKKRFDGPLAQDSSVQRVDKRPYETKGVETQMTPLFEVSTPQNETEFNGSAIARKRTRN